MDVDKQETETTAETTETEVQETPPEQTETPPAETDEAPPDQEAAPEGEKTEAAGEAEEKRRRKGGYQRTIERLEREKEILLEQLQRGQPAPAPKAAKDKTPDEVAEEWLNVKLEQKLAEREATAEAQRQAAETHRKEMEFAAQHDDYGEALDTFARSGMPKTHVQALLTAEHGPAIMYQLTKDPDELARIRALPPPKAWLEIGRLDARLASSTPAPKTAQKTATPRPTVPAPITPVKARGPTQSRDPGQQSYEEYAAAREAELARKR